MFLFYHGQLSKHIATLTDNAKSIVYRLLSGMKKDQGYSLFIDIVCSKLFLTSENR